MEKMEKMTNLQDLLGQLFRTSFLKRVGDDREAGW